VDPARALAVAKVGKREVEEVDNEQELCEPKVTPHKEIDKAEQEQVVGDEVAANVCGKVDRRRAGRVQCIRVAELQRKENEPVDGGEDAALRKRRRVVIVPEAVAMRAGWGVDGIVDAADE